MHRGGTPETTDPIARVQLERLVASILMKSPNELAEIASVNPAIYGEWIAEIRQRNNEAREEARKMSKALQSLVDAPERTGKSEIA